MFYGYQLGLTTKEILNYKYGQYRDLLSCHAVYNGSAVVKKERTFMDVLDLR